MNLPGKTGRFFLALVLAAFGLSSEAAEHINVQELNKKLNANGTWKAKDNWINHLSAAETKRLFGVKELHHNDISFRSASLQSFAKAGMPTKLDWRNRDGKNYVSPVLNQGNCGSCVAFASIATLETQLNVSSMVPDLNVKLSPQHLFACGGGACDFGWMPSSAANHLKVSGVTDEACMPYTSGATGEDVSCNSACNSVNSRLVKISGYSNPTMGTFDVDSLKAALQKGPMVTTLSVYADFMVYSSGVYKHTTGDMMGGHAVSIVGYDDSMHALIVRNSWGEDWGDKGFVYVDYDDVSGVGEETWLFEVPSMAGVVALNYPMDYTYVGGTVAFKGSATFSNAAAIKFNVYDKSNNVVLSSTIKSAKAEMPFDSSKVADGRYEVQAVSLTAEGTEIDHSTRNFFYVLNGKPNMMVDFKGHGIDLAQPLSGRIEMDITTSSQPVPMSELTFHIKDSAGKVTERTTKVVLDKMVTGWRTNLVPNGTYEIWYSAKISVDSSAAGEVESKHLSVKTQN